MKILSIDVGIKNLALCILESLDGKLTQGNSNGLILFGDFFLNVMLPICFFRTIKV